MWDISHRSPSKMFVLIQPLVFHCQSRYCREISPQNPAFDNTPYCFKYTLTINAAWTVSWLHSQSGDKDSVYLLKRVNSQHSSTQFAPSLIISQAVFGVSKAFCPELMHFWPWFQLIISMKLWNRLLRPRLQLPGSLLVVFPVLERGLYVNMLQRNESNLLFSSRLRITVIICS